MKLLNHLTTNKKMLFLTEFYAILALLFSFIILNAINTHFNIVSSKSKSNKNIATNSRAGNLNSKKNIAASDLSHKIKSTLTIPTNATDISISQDNKYCMYILNQAIYVVDATKNKLIHKIDARSGIASAVLLKDRDLILYFTISNSHVLNVRTYNIDNQRNILHKSFSIDKGFKIKTVQYSTLTNLILINTEKMTDNNITDKLYYINIMKNANRFPAQNTVNNMILLNNSLSLYYTNGKDKLYCNMKTISCLSNKRSKLLGRDRADHLYVQDLNQKNLVYVLNNNNISRTLKLNDGNFSKAVTSGDNIFLVYKDYVINITGDINKKFIYDSKLKFINLIGKNMYLRNTDNSIVIENTQS